MKKLPSKTVSMFLLPFALTFGSLAPARAQTQNQTDAATIRAGHTIAVTRCIACHVVSSKQPLAPVLGPGIPSFEEIANTPTKTAESLMTTMRTARWHDEALPRTLLPMSRLSDQERSQVVAYILTLRSRPRSGDAED